LSRVVETAYYQATTSPRSTPTLRDLVAAEDDAGGEGAGEPVKTTLFRPTPPPARDPRARFPLSQEYFRSVADVMAQAADAVGHRVRAGDPPAPRSLVPTVPEDLAAICRKALRPRPADRYPTPGEFAADLRRWLRHEPTRARGSWPIRRALLWARRNPGWA